MREKLYLYVALLIVLLAPRTTAADSYKVIGWNDLGMHCLDGVDYSLFGVLPPFNTFHAQVIDANGRLVRASAGASVTYQAGTDPNGSINTTSANKTNFWQYVQPLFGASPPPDMGLTGFLMPGSGNAARAMSFDGAKNWFTAEGVPLTPIDDAGRKNYFPLQHLVARDGNQNVVSTIDIVAPLSDEMDCAACHASGGSPAARPVAGWAWDPDPARDSKLNIMAIHDEHQAANANYIAALAALGYNAAGLKATALAGTPILCAKCHSSNALGGLGYGSIQSLTAAVHTRHADAVDPATGQPLGNSTDRAACYRCHPGVATKCLRGVMGRSVAPNGDYAIECQSCHGSMTLVGAPPRQGWLQEPTCQSCHTGTATDNAGAIRYTNAFVSPGVYRTAPNLRFATNNNAPAAGLSLYRFSFGHGDLSCEACHGSTHAEYPTRQQNDNLQSMKLQGHVGMLSDCDTCHAAPQTASAGPHGMHTIGAYWVSAHSDIAEHSGTAMCMDCHGPDYRGTVLSRALGDRQLSTEFGTKTFWRGFQVSCYACHNGPSSESATSNHAPSVQSVSMASHNGLPATVIVTATDADGNILTSRVVSQPMHGRAVINGSTALYTPDAGYSGSDSFTFAAWDGMTDSNLATASVTVSVVAPVTVDVVKNGTGSGVVTSVPSGINCGATCSATFPANSTATFTAVADADSFFAGWSGPCSGTSPCTLTLVQSVQLQATFTRRTSSYALIVTKVGTGSGTISSSPAGIVCGPTCNATFPAGAVVTLTASAAGGSFFAGWTGPCSGTSKCVVTMDQATSVTATFNKSRPRGVRP